MAQYMQIRTKASDDLILIDTSNSSSWVPPSGFLEASNPGSYSERAGWRGRVLREGWRFRGRGWGIWTIYRVVRKVLLTQKSPAPGRVRGGVSGVD